MPHKDREKRRAYFREYWRKRNAAGKPRIRSIEYRERANAKRRDREAKMSPTTKKEYLAKRAKKRSLRYLNDEQKRLHRNDGQRRRYHQNIDRYRGYGLINRKINLEKRRAYDRTKATETRRLAKIAKELLNQANQPKE